MNVSLSLGKLSELSKKWLLDIIHLLLPDPELLIVAATSVLPASGNTSDQLKFNLTLQNFVPQDTPMRIDLSLLIIVVFGLLVSDVVFYIGHKLMHQKVFVNGVTTCVS